MSNLIIGTRGSPLALWQANWVKARLEERHPGLDVYLKIIHTEGDKILDTPLAKVGGKGLFVKEIETDLLDGEIDLAVHSMKDVPTALPPELEISVVCEREDPRDAFIAREAGMTLATLPDKARVGTSSLRRQAQLLSRRPDLEIVPLRGNVGTRLRKLEELELDAVILAAAGLIRMEQAGLITEYLSAADSLPAVGQGALGIETRKDDGQTRARVEFLNHLPTQIAVEAERSFLARLEGGCQVPIAAHATVEGGAVTLDGLVASVDGSVIFRDTISGPVEDRAALGARLAGQLLSRGADKTLAEVYGQK